MLTPLPTSQTNGLATAALVVGIVSIPALLLCGLGGIVGLVAIVLGILGWSRAAKLPGSPGKGQAIGGLVAGTVAFLAGLAVVAALVLGWSSDINTDPADGYCDISRFMEDPDCE